MDKSNLLTNEAPNSTHYKGFAIEPLQFIEANRLGFAVGCVVKYVVRAGKKDGVDNLKINDLRKAEFYIKWLIEQAERELAEKEDRNRGN